MRPKGQTPALNKCEQLDLKHPRAMLQSEICPQNSPRGGGRAFVFWSMYYTLWGRKNRWPEIRLPSHAMVRIRCINYVLPFIALFSSELQSKDFVKRQSRRWKIIMKFDNYLSKSILSTVPVLLETIRLSLLYNLQLTLNFAHLIIFIKIFARNKLL